MSETTNDQAWGRVDDTLTVFVKDGDAEREVGQYPDGTPEEALAYFERKFADLEGQLTLLEARIARGTAGSDVARTVTKLQEQLVAPAIVGDIAALRARADKLSGKAEELTEQQQKEREEARAAAVAARETIVAEAERLAGQPQTQIRWKETGQAFEKLFTEWQEAQRSGAQVPKSTADALWKRFRSARQSFDAARRTHFAELDANNKEVKERKERLITQAEALAPRGTDGIASYRSLLDEWKAAGRASRKLDDQLWVRFKAAGDVLYEAKAAEIAEQDEEFGQNLVAKEALLTEGESILQVTDRGAARKQLTQLQLKWDEIGKVPRDSIRSVEARLRKIEDHVRSLEENHWNASDPEKKARSEGLRGQLEASIEELTEQIANEQDAKKKAEAEQKLQTQQAWLAAIRD